MIMTLQEYLANITDLRKLVNNIDLFDPGSADRRDFLLTQAAKNNFLPHQKHVKHEDFFRDILLYKEASALDIKTDLKVLYHFLNISGSEFLEAAKKAPAIFCTFHYGAYQLLLSYLRIAGIDFYIVTDQEQHVGELMAYSDNYDFVHEKVKIIKPTDWGVLLEMSKKLKEGSSIVIFLDKIDGVTSAEQKKGKLSTISFLGQQLYVRRGIPEISYLNNIPIIPVISYRKRWDNIDLDFSQPIIADKGEKKSAYTARVLQRCYNNLEKYAAQDAAQWEYWPEIFSRLDLTVFNPLQKFKNSFRGLFPDRKAVAEKTDALPIADTDICQFNTGRYGIYKEDEFYFLLDTNTYNCFKISNNLKNILSILEEKPASIFRLKTFISSTLFNELLFKEVLIVDRADVFS